MLSARRWRAGDGIATVGDGSELAELERAKRAAKPWLFVPAVLSGEAAVGRPQVPAAHRDHLSRSSSVVEFAFHIGAARQRRDLELLGRAMRAAADRSEIADGDVVLLDAYRANRVDQMTENWRRWRRTYQTARPMGRSTPGLIRNIKADAVRRRHRRDIQGLGLVPPSIRRDLTPGQEAVAAAYAEAHMALGRCDDAKKAIAGHAGVCERVVQRAQEVLVAAGKIKITRRPTAGSRHLSTVVEIVDPEWLGWLAKRKLAREVGDRRVRQTIPNTYADGSTSRLVSGEAQQSGQPSEEASKTAAAIAAIAGYQDGQPLPSSWRAARPAQIIQDWFDVLAAHHTCQPTPGYSTPPELVRTIAKWVMKRKPDPRPPRSIRYFESAIHDMITQANRSRAALVCVSRAGRSAA